MNKGYDMGLVIVAGDVQGCGVLLDVFLHASLAVFLEILFDVLLHSRNNAEDLALCKVESQASLPQRKLPPTKTPMPHT